MVLNSLSVDVHNIAFEKGWWDKERSFGELLMLIVTEVAEAMEEYRNGMPENRLYIKSGEPFGIPSELADIIIRVCDIAGRYGIDLDDAVAAKMEYNKTRPYRHGGKLA